MNIESKAWRIEERYGVTLVTNKSNGIIKSVDSSIVPKFSQLASAQEQKFDKLLKNLFVLGNP